MDGRGRSRRLDSWSHGKSHQNQEELLRPNAPHACNLNADNLKNFWSVHTVIGRNRSTIRLHNRQPFGRSAVFCFLTTCQCWRRCSQANSGGSVRNSILVISTHSSFFRVWHRTEYEHKPTPGVPYSTPLLMWSMPTPPLVLPSPSPRSSIASFDSSMSSLPVYIVHYCQTRWLIHSTEKTSSVWIPDLQWLLKQWNLLDISFIESSHL